MGDRSDGSVRSLCTDVFDSPTGGNDMRDGVSIDVGRVASPNPRGPGAVALAAIAGAAFLACGGEDVAGPTDTTALAAEVEAAFAVLASTAFGEVGRGVQYDEVLGGRGPETIAAHAGTLFRWSLEESRYVAAGEPGPEGGVRFVLYAALESVPHGAPLVETGSIAWFPADGGGLRAELTTEHGARLELTATGESRPVPQAQTLTITGSVIDAAGAVYKFDSTRRITPEDEGTHEADFRWTGPGGLDVRFSTFTTRITVFAGEDSSQEFTAVSEDGRAALVGGLLGGNGFFELSIDGVAVGTVEQISELSPDLFGGIEPAGEVDLTPEIEAAARTIFRAKNRASTGLSRLVVPVF
jgi:hypothetical protein